MEKPKGNMLNLDAWREIVKTRSRFLSLLLLSALAVAFLAGLRTTAPDMEYTADAYYDRTNLMDARVLSTLGLTEEDIAALSAFPGVEAAEGAWFVDASIHAPRTDLIVRFHSLSAVGINLPELVEGRLPQAEDECVVEPGFLEKAGLSVGDVIELDMAGTSYEDTLSRTRFTVVGTVTSSLYMSTDRGTSTIGTGRLSAVAFLPREVFAMDYYTEAYFRAEGLSGLMCYGEEYQDRVDALLEDMEPLGEERSQVRYGQVVGEATEKLNEAQQEFDDAEAEVNQKLRDAEAELADARQKLDDGWKEYYDGIDTLNREVADGQQKITDGEEELSDALAKLNDGEADYADGEAKLDDARTKYADGLAKYEEALADFREGEREYQDGLAQYADGLAQYEEGYDQYMEGREQLEEGEALYEENRLKLEDGQAKYDDGLAQYRAGVAAYREGQAELAKGKAELDANAENVAMARQILEETEETAGKAQEIYEDMNEFLEDSIDGDVNSDNLEEKLKDEGFRGELAGKLNDIRNNGINALPEGELRDALDQAIPSGDDLMDQVVDNEGEAAAGILDGMDTLGNALNERANLEKQVKAYDDGLAQYNAGVAQMAAADRQLDEAWAELQDAKKQLDDGRQQLADGRAELDEGWAQLDEAWDELAAAAAEISEQGKPLFEAKEQIEDGRRQLEEAKAELDDGLRQLVEGEEELADARKQLDDGWDEYYQGIDDLAEARVTLERESARGRQELADAFTELTDGERDYADGLQDYEDGKAEADEELSDARRQLNDARRKISEIENCKWYILGRNTNTGYVSYQQDAQRMGNLAQVFPLIFFLVAALVCLTTMTRMVEEQRIQIGGLKALGYSRMAIAKKYVGYGFLSSFGGGLAGLVVGCTLIPTIIFNAWKVMYTVGDLNLTLFPGIYAMAVGAAVVCVTGTALGASFAALTAVPATLMRPKAPPAGKRVLLERVDFIWKRLSFTWKVTVRNLFRYKKRFFMGVVGIGGCTALLIAGFGLRDAIQGFYDIQYEEITTYHGTINLAEKVTEDEMLEISRELDRQGYVESWAPMSSTMVTAESGKRTMDAFTYLCVVTGEQGMDGFICLRDRKTGEPVPLTDEGAVITEKLSEMLGVGVGDTITLISSDNTRVEVPITGLAENYIFHYIYLSPNAYRTLYGSEPETNSIMVRYTEDSEICSDTVASAVLPLAGVSSISRTDAVRQSVLRGLEGVDYAVIVVVAAAAALAFVVLYNLTNINITERLRELATLKVLGFNDRELSDYVYRENIFLTFFGILLGLVMGKYLHQWLVSTVEIDMAMFYRTVKPMSYVFSAALTVVFSALVNVVSQGKLRKIDMVESLKTVE